LPHRLLSVRPLSCISSISCITLSWLPPRYRQ
jgi:hypothetical protein